MTVCKLFQSLLACDSSPPIQIMLQDIEVVLLVGICKIFAWLSIFIYNFHPYKSISFTFIFIASFWITRCFTCKPFVIFNIYKQVIVLYFLVIYVIARLHFFWAWSILFSLLQLTAYLIICDDLSFSSPSACVNSVFINLCLDRELSI